MGVTQQQRHRLFTKAEAVFGPEEAAPFMEVVLPVSIDDLATKADLEHLRLMTRADLEHLRLELRADMERMRAHIVLGTSAPTPRCSAARRPSPSCCSRRRRQ